VTGDVLIIAHRADGVARRLEAALAARGRTASWLDGPAAARLFTIRVTAEGNVVTPELPIFIRPTQWWDGKSEATPDSRFLRNECHATFWAAAALASRPVINRPTPEGTVYPQTAGTLADTIAQFGEIHASGPEQIAEADGSFWGETVDSRVGPLATLPANVPLRARQVDPRAGYEIVAVVGSEAFLATRDRRSVQHGLAARSVALAHKLGVHFATVTWAVTDDAASSVRLNPSPQEHELRYRWADVLDALCRDLLA